MAKRGILLLNLGTPDTAKPDAIKRYLREFLGDPDVIDLPRWLWLPLLNGIILPIRSKKLVESYEKIWTEKGAPLLAMTQAAAVKLQALFPKDKVVVGMRYGNPPLEDALKKLEASSVDEIIVLPLYPQYSKTTTGTTIKKIHK